MVSEDRLKELIQIYISDTQKRNFIFNEIHIFLQSIINGALYSFGITDVEQLRKSFYYEDIKAGCMLKLLEVIGSMNVKTVKNVKNFLYITAKNYIADNVRKINIIQREKNIFLNYDRTLKSYDYGNETGL